MACGTAVSNLLKAGYSPAATPPDTSKTKTVPCERRQCAALREIVRRLMTELATTMEQPELYGMVHDALTKPEEPALDALRNMASLVSSLPARTKVAKDLAEALHKCIGMEREAFGLDTATGTDGLPLVIIKDYTGRGDPDAPVRPASHD